ncbi:MAG: inverse autotransporter beta domain-containing protein [Chthoniobacteraceae bacterium]
MTVIRNLILATAVAALLIPAARAGHELAPTGKEMKEAPPVREWFPDEPRGFVTVGAKFSDHATGIFADSITGLWSPQARDAFVFLNSRYSWEDNHQYISSVGLGVRKLLPDHDVILGANAYWDSLHGGSGSEFNQLGLGAEVLTKWVDARLNYYLPDNNQPQVRRHTWRSSDDGGERIRIFERREAALQGFNAELGFLVPGLCNYTEVRIYGGYYRYDNPFGSDFEGFKARLEARLLPGVIADVEYWDDAALMGGHWTAGVRVSVPFSIVNLVNGRNPFEGFAGQFAPRQREFKERMSDMVERSHRIQTVTSGDRLSEDSFNKDLRFANGVRVGANGLPIE